MKKILKKAKTERQRKEVLAAALIERKFRRERKRQAADGGLMHFVRYFWDVLEPGAEFIDGWHLHALCEHLEAMHRGDMTRLLINVPPGAMKSLLVNVFFPAWVWSAGGRADLRFVSFSYGSYLTERDNERMLTLLKSQKFIDLWGNAFKLTAEGKVKISNSKRGWKFASSVGGVGTGERGDYILLDDPHNVKDGDASVIRENTVRWFKEAMSNRLNDMVKSRIIVIMQRVADDDVAGTILDEELPYEHLMIPMEYEPHRHCETSIGWADPRGAEGECYWPERFPPEAVADCKAQGPFAWACTPFESPLLMSDLSLKPIGEVRVGDEVVGFSSGGGKGRKRHLLKAKVIDVHVSTRPVVKVVLDSGGVIRCTADHKWFMKRSGRDSHQEYLPASVGRSLHRVCPPRIQKVLSVEEAFDVGYLAGFFDGEGTVSVQRRPNSEGHYAKSSSLIQLTQSLGRNRPIAENIEKVLHKLGFEYGYKDVRVGHETWDACRQFYLTGRRLPLLQRFLHYVNPKKWRDRLADGAYGTKFIIGSERVMSIEPDGVEPVYGITTTTGNYVVWGLASSNSQYQQRPQVRGNEIFNPEWWNIWDPPDGKFPDLDYVIAVLDPAFTSKDDNDPSGFVVLGAFCTDEGNRAVILLNAWREWLQLHGRDTDKLPGETRAAHKSRTKGDWGLVETVADSCRRFGVDRLIIESKACGISVAQEMQRLYREDNWFVELVDPKGLDKMARAQRVQPIFSEGQVWAPDRKWATMVINEMAVFPRGKHDDLVDAMTYGLWHLRERGYLTRKAERRAANEAGKKYEKRQAALYPV